MPSLVAADVAAGARTATYRFGRDYVGVACSAGTVSAGRATTVSREEAGVTDVLAKIPLLGWGPLITVAAITVSCLIIAFLLWRKHKVWRSLFIALFLVFGVSTAAAAVNMQFAYLRQRRRPAGHADLPHHHGNVSGPDVKPQPNGATSRSTSLTPHSKFGTYQAQVWLPPQYFTNPRQHFPVVYLLHGNPGQPTDWLTSVGGGDHRPRRREQPATRPSSSCRRTSRTTSRGQPLCRQRQSRATPRRTSPRTSIAASTRSFRTDHQRQGPRHRRLVDGRLLRAEPRPQAPRPLLGRRWTSPERRRPTPDTLRGGTRRSTAAPTGSRRPTPTARPSTRPAERQQGPGDLDGRRHRGPAMLAEMQALAAQAQGRGFTVEFRQLARESRLHHLDGGAQGRPALGGCSAQSGVLTACCQAGIAHPAAPLTPP